MTERNPYHVPAGSSEGGQFTTGQLDIISNAARKGAKLPLSQVLKNPINAYHITYKENVDKIKSEGLTSGNYNPALGDSGRYEIDGVFVANASQAQSIYQQMSEAGGLMTILEVYLPRGTTVYEDRLMPESSLIVRYVPKRFIREITLAQLRNRMDEFEF